MTIATKEQERKILEKIRQMVADLGENSYLASAFDGAFELAEQNIEDDAAYSTQYYIDQYHSLSGENKELAKRNKELTTSLEAVQKAHEATSNSLNTTAALVGKHVNKIDELEAELHYEQSKVTELKAKLYDYMTAAS
ncbi:Hypothetical protein DPCES_5337 [Desulfitobacterium hafniense]|uniref:Uncharacterized protein n=1 Tax=Desulfitobacterium hafniense TaxID=49338 RepID=A0A098AU80_DESHA|nr:hypothetical protein [Desulfitobacterium hafniense]CDV96335.1 Hypothetical protein DPCES_5337 [Desulfitobacterium hafniense]